MVHVPLSPQRCLLRFLHSPSLGFVTAAMVVAAAAVTALVAGCSRTGLYIDEGFAVPVADSAIADDRADAGPDADAAEDTFIGAEAAAPPDPCANMPPIPCPGGGYEYCVAGQYSACPQRCGVCIPGSQQVCFISYCRSWGIQTCAADGLSFGYCQEQSPPSQCGSIADQDHESPALEQCCIDNGYCCQDQFDLNGNGMTGEPVGQCSGVTCSP